jgi:lipopolysaccharide/colanic/teichoic acid biosynthesis glycosyltransferase
MGRWKTISILFSWLIAFSAMGEEPVVSSLEGMRALQPESSARLKVYDTVFKNIAKEGAQAQQRYSDPARLEDLARRIRRAEKTGDVSDVLTADEKVRFTENSARLKQLESVYFEKGALAAAMNAGEKTQELVVKTTSRMPTGQAKSELVEFWKNNHAKNPLYSNWDQNAAGTHAKWSEVFERFSTDAKFRESWIATHPDSLPLMKSMASVRAWDDTSVRSVQVLNAGQPNEYWILDYDRKFSGPNRFDATVRRDYERLLQIEFAPTLIFNRLAKIEQSKFADGKVADIYNLIPVSKGRTMAPAAHFSETGSDKRPYRGAELLRKTKIDEFQQRELIKSGDLSLFLGGRTMSLHEAQKLNERYPTLTKAVGQFGFSITGGLAQTTSNRTDGVEKQAAKLTATLMDVVDFANTKDVDAWFKTNTQQVLRTIAGGVGAGGAAGNFEPGRSKSALELAKQADVDCASASIVKGLTRLIEN